jgi:hypothetical protein
MLVCILGSGGRELSDQSCCGRTTWQCLQTLSHESFLTDYLGLCHFWTVVHTNTIDPNDEEEVEHTLDSVEPPPTVSTSRDCWASSSQATTLPDFLADHTVRAIGTHQLCLAAP